MQLQNLVKYGTDQEVRDNLAFIGKRLAHLSENIEHSKPRDNTNLLLYNLTRYAIVQLNSIRLVDHLATEYYAL